MRNTSAGRRPVLMHISAVLPLISLLLLFILAIPISAESAEPKGYVIRQAIPVFGKSSGLNGRIEILEDARITPEIRKNMWGICPIMLLDEEARNLFRDKSPRHAVIRVFDKKGKQTYSETLDDVLASIDKIEKPAGKSQLYCLTVDKSAGIGSYSGPMSSFFTIEKRGPVWLESYEGSGGTARLTAMRSPKSDWKIVAGKTRGDRELLAVSCRPAAEDGKGGYVEFRIYYSRYHLGDICIKSEHSEVGFWESGDNAFPGMDKFY